MGENCYDVVWFDDCVFVWGEFVVVLFDGDDECFVVENFLFGGVFECEVGYWCVGLYGDFDDVCVVGEVDEIVGFGCVIVVVGVEWVVGGE